VWVISFEPILALKIQYLPLGAVLANLVLAASVLAAAFDLRATPFGVLTVSVFVVLVDLGGISVK
jgi:hypothetical protein